MTVIISDELNGGRILYNSEKPKKSRNDEAGHSQPEMGEPTKNRPEVGTDGDAAEDGLSQPTPDAPPLQKEPTPTPKHGILIPSRTIRDIRRRLGRINPPAPDMPSA